MKEAVGTIFPVNQAMGAATIASNPIFTADLYGYSYQPNWTGTPTGDFTLEVSNDIGYVNPTTGVVTGVTNWSPMDNSTHAAGGAAGNWMYIVSDVYYRWVRLKYTGASGTGVLNGNYSLKSV